MASSSARSEETSAEADVHEANNNQIQFHLTFQLLTMPPRRPRRQRASTSSASAPAPAPARQRRASTSSASASATATAPALARQRRHVLCVVTIRHVGTQTCPVVCAQFLCVLTHFVNERLCAINCGINPTTCFGRPQESKATIG